MRTTFVFVLWLMSCPALLAQSNVLMLLADDVGVDTVNVYGEHPVPAKTPNIDELAAQGILFRNAYANPACSPTRATILSGRFGWRTGVGTVFGAAALIPEMELTGLTTLPDALKAANYSSAVVGKWHLGGDLQFPLDAGFDQVLGSPTSVKDYFYFPKNVNGTLQVSTTYATTDTVDDALALMQTLPEPWFIWLAFNSAHVPYHVPPANLQGTVLPQTVAGNEPYYSRAIIEAMDTEIGRLMESVDTTDTTVLFVGDNGPEGVAVLPPWSDAHAKTTIYEQGVRVPLIVTGPGVVQGAECAALVNTTDLYATIADLAGASKASGLDSVSLVPYFSNPGAKSQRQYAFVEAFQPNFLPSAGFPETFQRRTKAVRGKRYKLIHGYQPTSPVPGTRELYDLVTDPLETTNLLEGPLSPEIDAIYTQLEVQLVNNGPIPWIELPGGVPGALGTPKLMGSGSLVPGTLTSIRLSGAASHAPGALVMGWDVANLPFLCGVMIPSVDSLLWFTTDLGGSVVQALPWPELPPLTQVAFQFWIRDPAAPCGYSASNGITGTSAP